MRAAARTFGERRVAGDLAVDVADQPSQAGAQELELAVGAPELVGVRIPGDHDRRPFCDPPIALPEHDAVALGEADQLLDRLVSEPGVGRMGDRLRLHRWRPARGPWSPALPFRGRPASSPAGAPKAAPRRAAGASASATSGRRRACGGTRARHRNTENRGSQPSARTEPRR
jgi:hypothetical protein